MSVTQVLLRGIIVCLWVSVSIGLTAQVMTNGANLDIQAGASLTIQGGLQNEGTGMIANDGVMTLEGDLINNSSQASTGLGLVQLSGSASQTIGGSSESEFFDLQTDNSSGVILDQSIKVENTMEMISGNVDLNSQIITLSQTAELVGETDTSRIFGAAGEIRTTRDLGTPAGLDIAGLGVEITSSVNLGTTTIARGHSAQAVGAGSSIERYFDIVPENNSNLDADFRMYYFPAELNGQDQALLSLFRLNPGASNWTPAGGNASVIDHFVEQSGIDAMALWTLSADGTTGITDLRPELSVGFFPNPVISGQALSLTGLERGNYEFVLYDVRGKRIAQQSLTAPAAQTKFQVSLPPLTQGMYTFQLLSEDFRPMLGKLMILSH